jgi:probable DNA repair protein
MGISNLQLLTQIPNLPTQTVNYTTVFSRLQSGHTVVTGNSRLARALTGQYNQWRIGRGDRQWQSPDCVPWSQWLGKLWEQAGLEAVTGTGRAVPGDWQLICLWESTLKEGTLKHDLIRPESLASQLRDTRKLVTEWQLDSKDPAWFGNDNENCTAFYHWNQAFEKRCKKDNWISPEDRTSQLCNAIGEKLFSPVHTIDLLGFDEFNPGQAALLSAMVENGVSVCQLTIDSRQDKAALWKSRDSKDELDRMARWVRYWIEKEPGCGIAVVVPDLQVRRQAIERALENILVPGQNPSDQREKPWNISMGTPLLHLPMIETAFDLLKLLDSRVDIQDVGRVLRSPWFRGATRERNSRALLEKCLRDNYPRQIKAGEIRYRSGEVRKHDHHHNELPVGEQGPQAWNCPELSVVLNSLKRFDSDHKGALPASAWAESLNRLLISIGWPLAEDLPEQHDVNWQALQAWQDALRDLASLDATVPLMGRSMAISQLKHICRERIFQARTTPAPVQILGLYEVSGLRFDHLWVLGLHNDNWPPSARPNPFIPAKLQRAAQSPGSSPQRELAVASTITRRLLETAPDCVFSYPGTYEGEERLASPLLELDGIRKLPEMPAWQNKSWLEVLVAASPPQSSNLEHPGKLVYGTARGGSSILKHQALCPFRAFASNRLGAEILETPADGITPMLHGSLVHRVLEHVWKEIKTQSTLLSLEEENLGKLVQKHVDYVTNEERGLKLRPAFRNVEAARVFRHVMECLDLEKQREAFEVIAYEKEILPEIEGQAVRLIIDRVDQLPSGEQIIIDYKTGEIDPKKWFGDRPEEPQLPLYAISAEKAPSGVVFNIIRDAGCEYKGVVKRGGLLPDLPKSGKAGQFLVDAGEDMTETVAQWRRIAGEAAIDPKNGLDTCKTSYCELQSVCRIGELERRRKSGAMADQQGFSI